MPDLPPDTPDDRPPLEMPSFSLRRRKPAREHRPRRARTAPPLTGLPAALLTGLAVGALAVAYAWLAGAACDAVRGTTSCGGAAGLPILLAGLVLLAWVGALLLRLFGVADAGSTSILAVGVLSVLVMLFLLDSLDEPWAAVVVPALAVLGYGLSWWVTASVVGEEPEVPEPHDVR
jgi:hypothetical protein